MKGKVLQKIRTFLPITLLLLLLLPSCSQPVPIQTTSTLPPCAQAVENFLKALSQKDYDSAYFLQSERVRTRIPIEDFRDLNRLSYEAYQIKSQEWEIKSWEEGTETATVFISLTSNFTDGTSLTREGKYVLIKENGEWKIDAVYSLEQESP